MELPYYAIDISVSEGKLNLLVTAIDEGSPVSRKLGGITADFKIKLDVGNIVADFKCWISIGNLYAFYIDLQKCYENLQGVAILKDYSETLTNISFSFYECGKVDIHGYAKDGAYTRNRIEFGIKCDQTYISPLLKSLNLLFDELAIMQGYYDFPY